MTGEELYEIQRRVAFREGTILPQWITLHETDRRLWDKTADGILRVRTVLAGFVPTMHRPALPLPPRMGRPWRTKLPDDPNVTRACEEEMASRNRPRR